MSLSYASRYWVRTEIELGVAAAAIPEILMLAGVAYALKTRLKDARRLTLFLNLFAAALIAIPLAEIISTKTPSMARATRVPVPYPLAARPSSKHLPDIYYIILDGYARNDIMKSRFGLDTAPFLDRLEKQGFYLARDSMANYCQTGLSLSASLNASLSRRTRQGTRHDQTELSDLIGKNNVVATLKPLGYKFVTFATGFDPTEHPEADVYLSPHSFANGFERMVVDITPLRRIWPNPKNLKPRVHVTRPNFVPARSLARGDSDPAPTFTFAHVFCPHPPIIFGPNGEDVRLKYIRYTVATKDRVNGRFCEPEFFARGYRDQSAFITARIEETIKQILARSPEPPIIILQSDHGSELNLDMFDVNHTDLRERMRILNAYYFPGGKYKALYSEITPVNSFRVVLNTLFGAHLELLPDRSFYSTWGEPYQFIDVTERLPPEPEGDSAHRARISDAGTAIVH